MLRNKGASVVMSAGCLITDGCRLCTASRSPTHQLCVNVNVPGWEGGQNSGRIVGHISLAATEPYSTGHYK